ncbi:hypothetical protein TNCV_4049821 [Trichonephila clavipes]|nr:hypothetical protein TNCV_4049821 [Trichonephila clavipes]
MIVTYIRTDSISMVHQLILSGKLFFISGLLLKPPSVVVVSFPKGGNESCQTVWTPIFHPNFEGEHPEGGQMPPTSLLLPPMSREDLRLDGYLLYPHAAKALYIYEHPSLFIGIRTHALRHSSQRR